MNHGYCINCWWYLAIKGRHFINTNDGLKIKHGYGRCYMHDSDEGKFTTVEGDCYCPDYYARRRGDKEMKMTIQQWIETL